MMEGGKKAMAYYLELLSRAEPDEPITIVMNLQGSGLSHSNMDYLKFFIFLLSDAYPNGIRQLLVLDLPWVLKSIWNIVKLWLDEKQKSWVQTLVIKNVKSSVSYFTWSTGIRYGPTGYYRMLLWMWRFLQDGNEFTSVKRILNRLLNKSGLIVNSWTINPESGFPY